MSLTLLRLAAVLYVAATAGYLIYFARPRHALAARVGAWFLAGAFAVHTASMGLGCKEAGGLEFFSLRGGFSLTGWALAVAYLLVQRFYHLPAVGAFVTPLVLLILAPTLVGEGHQAEVAKETLQNPALTVHIFTAAAGVALFAIAFGVALMYVLQEREVKGKKFGALFSRLPPLQSLDTLTQRLVRLGFVIFTVALLLGAFTAKAVWKSAWSWDPQQITSLAIWLFYGALVQVRHAGWHGRRFALLTMAGFALVVVTRLGVRAVPGLTIHSGSYSNTPPAGGTP
jgi:ABC-type transport system involved in cytochrome c biogenesis permease subunit